MVDFKLKIKISTSKKQRVVKQKRAKQNLPRTGNILTAEARFYEIFLQSSHGFACHLRLAMNAFISHAQSITAHKLVLIAPICGRMARLSSSECLKKRCTFLTLKRKPGHSYGADREHCN